jgi:uncharacterized protein
MSMLRFAAAQREIAAELIRGFSRDTTGVHHAVLLGVDGLAIAASGGLNPEQVDKLAATASALIGIAKTMANEHAAGYPEVLTIRTENIYFLFMYVADLAALAVLADRNSNLGVVGHQMQRLVAAIGQRLNPDPRTFVQPVPTRGY